MKVSFVVVSYQGEALISRCLSSILAIEDKCEYEIVIIDDGSTDQSFEKFSRYAEDFSNVKAFQNEKNLGRAASRNRGLKAAFGNYICFVDIDDFVSAVYFDRINEALSHGYDLIVAGRLDFDNDTHHLYARSHTDNFFAGVTLLDMAVDYPACFRDNFITGKFISREMLSAHNIQFNETRRNAEDILFSTKLWLTANRLRFVPAPFYNYGRGNYRANFSIQKCTDVFVNLAMLKDLTGPNPSPEVREVIANKYAILAFENVQRANGLIPNHSLANILEKLFDLEAFRDIEQLRFTNEKVRSFIHLCKQRQYRAAIVAARS